MLMRLCFSDYYYHRVFSTALLVGRAVSRWRRGYGEAQVLLTQTEYRRWRKLGPYR